MEAAFLRAIEESPAGVENWLVLSDWLEESGQADRAELVRLQVRLRLEATFRARSADERRQRALLAAGVRPCVSEVVNSLGMRLALVPPGAFWMGSPHRRGAADDDEFPHHRVSLTRPFYLGVHQVTQGQFAQVMGANPSHFSPTGGGARLVKHLDAAALPADSVSFDDVEELCRRLSDLPEERRAGRRYRPPTEAEWEYACRAGACHTAYWHGSRLARRDARFGGHNGGHPLPVGAFRANGFGLHDMHGNVWEWCSDWYAEDYYARSPSADPRGPAAGSRRVLRGGGWSTPATLCRAALRGHNTPEARHNYNGVRVAMEVVR